MEEPKGSFLLPEDTDEEYVFVAGGIGITVFRSMLRFIADSRSRTASRSSTRTATASRAAFLDELEELEERIDGLRVVLTMTDEPGWAGETRHLDANVLGELVGGLDGKMFLVAGPPQMAEAVADSLTGAASPEERVLADKFSGY